METVSIVRRMSVNTSLKNAKIFDDDAWEEIDGKEIKKEIKVEFEMDNCCILNNIKKEPQENDGKIKREPQDSTLENKMGHEVSCIKNITFNDMGYEDSYLKKDPITYISSEESYIKKDTFNETLEEGELRDSFCSYQTVEESACKTPPSPLHTKIKPDPDKDVDAMFDNSPYNKELFNSLRINEHTPIKTEEEEESNNSTKNILKSAKRTVFSRLSPYKRFSNDVTCEKSMSAKSRLGPKTNDLKRPREQPNRELEMDAAVLARREKQIEYGKNTIGYDRYLDLVPREKRKLGDPQTPDKFEKYSRRGWDGLIRQWRLKLHTYDSPDT